MNSDPLSTGGAAPDSFQDPGGRHGLVVSGPGGTAKLTLLGAHVQSWTTPDGREQFFMSRDASFAPAVASRGGVPIVFPWFGAHPSQADLPAHGFARTKEWARVQPDGDGGSGASLTLRLEDDDETIALWPHRFRADYTVSLEKGLQLTLEVTNLDHEAVEFESALHTYFDVADVHRASVHGLEGVKFTEFAKRPEPSTDPNAPIRFVAETDRVFQGVPDDIELRAEALERTTLIRTRGAGSAVVWNPWIEKAAAMGQMQDDEWQRFVCVESANCKEGRIRLDAGASHIMTVRLSVR